MVVGVVTNFIRFEARILVRLREWYTGRVPDRNEAALCSSCEAHSFAYLAVSSRYLSGNAIGIVFPISICTSDGIRQKWSPGTIARIPRGMKFANCHHFAFVITVPGAIVSFGRAFSGDSQANSLCTKEEADRKCEQLEHADVYHHNPKTCHCGLRMFSGLAREIRPVM